MSWEYDGLDGIDADDSRVDRGSEQIAEWDQDLASKGSLADDNWLAALCNSVEAPTLSGEAPMLVTPGFFNPKRARMERQRANALPLAADTTLNDGVRPIVLPGNVVVSNNEGATLVAKLPDKTFRPRFRQPKDEAPGEAIQAPQVNVGKPPTRDTVLALLREGSVSQEAARHALSEMDASKARQQVIAMSKNQQKVQALAAPQAMSKVGIEQLPSLNDAPPNGNDAREKFISPIPEVAAQQMAPKVPARVPVGASRLDAPRWNPNPSKPLEEQLRERLEFERIHGPQEVIQEVSNQQVPMSLYGRIHQDISRGQASASNGGPLATFEAGRAASPWAELERGKSHTKLADSEWDQLDDATAHPPEPESMPAMLTPEIAADDKFNIIALLTRIGALMGDENWLTWETETIEAMLARQGLRLSPVNSGKLSATKTLINSQVFFTKARAFEKVCVAFNNRAVDFASHQPVSVAEMTATILLIQNHLREIGDFGPEVMSYVAAHALDEGYALLPGPLEFATPPFVNQVLRTKGEVAIRLADQVHQTYAALPTEDAELMRSLMSMPEELQVQCMRLLRVNIYAQDMLDEAYE